MSFIPNVQGQPAQCPDNVQVDTLFPLTSGNGVQIQGRTSGTAIAAGMVGERLTNTGGATMNASETFYTAASQTVNKGVYLVSGKFTVSMSGVNSATSTYYEAYIYNGATAVDESHIARPGTSVYGSFSLIDGVVPVIITVTSDATAVSLKVAQKFAGVTNPALTGSISLTRIA